MSKITVAQLAQELNLKIAQLLDILKDLGVEAESGVSELDSDTVETISDVVAEMDEELVQIRVTEGMNVRDLAALLEEPAQALQKKLMAWGQLVGLTQALKPEIIEKLVSEFGLTPIWGKAAKPIAAKPHKPKKSAPGAQTRAPIVTILGHVDHGKTTLLDYIRKSAVADKEFGGITQHIGAYQAEVNGRKITFLDTPGHEAFSKMRARGAQATDIAILVVAADDGVMPQTIEAINHAKSAKVEIIIAINKVDKEEANVQRVQQMLAEQGLMPREWGGSTEMVPVSAKAGTGVDHLLETILLTADIMELQADPNAPLLGVVIEAKLDKGRGTVATLLVQEGTLRLGDSVSIGSCYGKIKAMFDYKGDRIEEAGPATPVEILGLSSAPSPGDQVIAHADEKTARSVAEKAADQERQKRLSAGSQRASLQDLFRKMSEGEMKELNVVLKADVGGSLEAISDKLAEMKNDEVELKLIYTGVGNITESDVDFAYAANAIIVGFNVKIENAAQALRERHSVEVRTYKIIYDLMEDIEKAMKGMLEPKFEEIELGSAEVRTVFKLTKSGIIAGSYVLEGKIVRNAQARLLRNKEQIWEGKIVSLKHLKEDVRDIAAGYECGIGLDSMDDIKEGDIIQAFEVRQVM